MADGIPPGVELGPARDGEIALVRKTWLETAARASPWRYMRWEDFREWHGKGVDAYVARKGAMVLVLREGPRGREEVVGWAAFEAPAVLHYVWVRGNCRRRASGWDLSRGLVEALPQEPLWYTHWTTWGRTLVARRLPAARFVPHLFG